MSWKKWELVYFSLYFENDKTLDEHKKEHMISF